MEDNLRPSAPISPWLAIAPGMGMFAGKNYAGGQILPSGQLPTQEIWNVTPVNFVDAVTRNHDLNYTWVEQVYGTADPANDNPLKTDINRALWQADKEMLINLLSYRPAENDFISGYYIDLAIKGFSYLNASRGIDVRNEWQELAHLNPKYITPPVVDPKATVGEFLTTLGALSDGSNFQTSGLEALTKGGLNIQQALLLNQHITSAQGLRKQDDAGVDGAAYSYDNKVIEYRRDSTSTEVKYVTDEVWIGGMKVTATLTVDKDNLTTKSFTREVRDGSTGRLVEIQEGSAVPDTQDKYGQSDIRVTKTIFAEDGSNTVSEYIQPRPPSPEVQKSAHLTAQEELIKSGGLTGLTEAEKAQKRDDEALYRAGGDPNLQPDRTNPAYWEAVAVDGLDGWAVKSQTEYSSGAVTSELVDSDGNTRMTAAPGELMTWTSSGVFTLARANGAKHHFDPATGTNIYQAADGSGYVSNDQSGFSVSFGPAGLTVNADGSYRVQPSDGAPSIELFKAGPSDYQMPIEYTSSEMISRYLALMDDSAHTLDFASRVTERQRYGFYPQPEVASRLGQLGRADASQFMQTGFAAAGEQNAPLAQLQFTTGGTTYLWSSGYASLTLTNGLGWNAVGNGATATSGTFTVSQTLIDAMAGIGGAKNHRSPLVLDLDGDGVAGDLTHAYTDGKVFFDIDADGFAERIGWVNPDDGLLAMDVNGNGRIDDITELYGDDQMPAFQKLRGIDGNADGQIDANDAAFATLRIWQDAHQDGISQDGELKTLASLGIQSISTNDHTDSRWSKENYISSATTYTRLENGALVSREIADVHFLNDNANTWYLGAQSQVYGAEVQIDLEATLLPLSRGYGSLPSLHLAMSANPELKRMVKELAQLPVERIGEAAGRVDDILLEWAGVRGNDPNARSWADGTLIDAREVDFIEKFTGVAWAQRDAAPLVAEDAATALKKTWSGIHGTLLHRLMAQGALKTVLPALSYDFATDKTVLNDSLDALLARAGSLAPPTDLERQDYWTLLGSILVENREELGRTVALLKSRRWRYGDCSDAEVAANDQVFAMRRQG